MVQNCNYFKYDFFQSLFSEWKPYMASFLSKNYFCFSSSSKENVVQGTLSPFYHAPKQLAIPLNKLSYH